MILHIFAHKYSIIWDGLWYLSKSFQTSGGVVAQQCHMASVNLVNIGSGNDLSPAWYQVNPWHLLPIEPLGTDLSEFYSKIKKNTQEIAFKLSSAK